MMIDCHQASVWASLRAKFDNQPTSDVTQQKAEDKIKLKIYILRRWKQTYLTSEWETENRIVNSFLCFIAKKKTK